MGKRSSDIPKGIRKEYRAVVRAAREQGWEFERRGGYPIAWPPDKSKRPVPIPLTPASHKRSFENWLSQMRAAGLEWP